MAERLTELPQGEIFDFDYPNVSRKPLSKEAINVEINEVLARYYLAMAVGFSIALPALSFTLPKTLDAVVNNSNSEAILWGTGAIVSMAVTSGASILSFYKFPVAKFRKAIYG